MGAQTPEAARHVLFLNWRDTLNPEGGGSEVYVERVAAELVASGHRATVLCAAHTHGSPRETAPTGVRIVRRGGRRTVYVWAALTYLAGCLGFGCLARYRGGRPDVIVDVCNGIPFLAPLYSRRPVISLVHHIHREQWQVVLPGYRGRIGWWIESRIAPLIYRRCNYITVSRSTKAELTDLGVSADRVEVVYNGTPQPNAGEIARDSTPSLVVLGRLVPHKQVEVALHSVARLRHEFPDLRLVIAGRGWWESHLRELALSLDIGERVHFAGFVSEQEKHELLSRSWIALAPSLKEGWGQTIVEAGIRGTPTIAFRGAGGVTEAIVDGHTGLLADDEADFIDKVRHLLTDEEYRNAMGQAARVHAESFTWTEAGQRFAALITRAASASR